MLDDFDGFGTSLASLGDLDGDGVGDLAVGTGGDDDGGFDHGAVWILFLNTDGTVKAHQKISDTEGGFTGTLDDGDFFGQSVASLGDLDGDGVGDLAVGAGADDDGGFNRGAVWILFLNPDGTVKSHQKISDTEGSFTGILDNLDIFGISVASLDDLDGDTVNDLAVGAFADDDGGDARGAVWILFLNPDGTVKSHQKISDTEGGFTGMLHNLDKFGWSLTAMGDLNGDCVQDLTAGTFADNDGGIGRGAVWVLFLNADGTVKSHQKISDTEGGFTGTLDDNDIFGISVAGLGDLDGDGKGDLAVGAHRDDDGGLNRGAVWILFLDGVAITDCNANGSDDECDIADGTSTDCNANGIPDECELRFAETSKLLPNDGAAGDRFGISVAISETTAIVGARANDDNGADSGSAYLFDMSDPANPVQLFKLLPEDGAADDLFGGSVAISETTVIVGALFDDDNGVDSGSAYVFDTTTGTQIAKLLPDDGAAGDTFAFKVAVDGDTVVVGSSANDDNGADSGSAYVFVRDGNGVWTQQAKLLPDDGQAGDFFGTRVSVSGDTAVVGAIFDDDNGTDSGSAYIFVRDRNGDWSQQAKLLPDDGQAGDNFGGAVSISGETVVIGARFDDDNGIDSGSTYVFLGDGNGVWSQQFKLLPDDGAGDDQFGFSVAISGTTAFVGAWSNDHNGTDSGSAYMFDTATGQQFTKLLASDGAAHDRFGLSVAISDATAIVGAFLDDDNGIDSGSVYIFERSSDCNGNGVPDECDIADGASTDCNANGIPDECEPPPCPADLDGSCDVGVKDLLFLLGAWGPCPKKGDCPADFDGNDDVGVKDLLSLLGAWGPCP
ncbi:MAG: FG-GAP repeat protein [Acidobacteria bacterium]|nr:FG-GAP repeat protein [Acidobacteriota bacterium]